MSEKTRSLMTRSCISGVGTAEAGEDARRCVMRPNGSCGAGERLSR